MYVAGVDVVQACLERDVARAGEGGRWRGVNVAHFIIGMKRGEVHRHVGAEVLFDPLALGGDFFAGIVFAGDQ